MLYKAVDITGVLIVDVQVQPCFITLHYSADKLSYIALSQLVNNDAYFE